MTKQKQSKKKVWERGEKADAVAAISTAYLKTSMTASITDLCAVVRREITRQRLDIDITPSVLRGILTADKRKFNFVRIEGGCMHLASEKGLMYDILKRINEKMEIPGKVHHLRSVPKPQEERVAIRA